MISSYHEQEPGSHPIKVAPGHHGRLNLGRLTSTYFNAVETVENVVFKFVPSACTVAMIATAMPAAMRPYSMAVAPDSSRMNRVIDAPIDSSCANCPVEGSFCRPHAMVQ